VYLSYSSSYTILRRSAKSAGASLILCLFCACNNYSQDANTKEPMINGVCLVAPRDSTMLRELPKLERISPNFVAVIPYAFKKSNESRVIYSRDNPYWWGEGLNGSRETIRQLKQLGYKIMLKPHVWLAGEGWPGDFDPTQRHSGDRVESEWSIWETSYREYILQMVSLAENEGVAILCIGTEYRYAVKRRTAFWAELIKEVRSIYKGKLTYASNWDNYEQVSFWKDLDFIGIDAYFPLSDSKRPEVSELLEAWNPIKKSILEFSDSIGKPILFTEYGYRSIPYNTRGDWKNEEVSALDEEAQSIAYQALYQSWWNEKRFAGGFLWKWHPADSLYKTNGAKGRFSPQGKRVESVIKAQYDHF